MNTLSEHETPSEGFSQADIDELIRLCADILEKARSLLKVDAYLLTDRDYVVMPETALKIKDEAFTYIAMNKKDFEILLGNGTIVKAEISPYLSIAGIPVIEDTQRIIDLVAKKAMKQWQGGLMELIYNPDITQFSIDHHHTREGDEK